MNTTRLETLVRIHQAELFRYLRYLGAHPVSTAEDLVQETFLAALRGGEPATEGEVAQGAWLRGIARNLFLNHCRKEKSRRTTITAEAAEIADTVWSREFLREGDGFDYLSALRNCLTRVPPGKRKLLDLFYREGLSRERLAVVTQMTEDGVKSALRRVRDQLAACIHASLVAEAP
ncbi:MAG: RNA polymerase sigma factor [Gemmataceae bacterium]